MSQVLKTLIDELLEKQQLLTPVTRFSEKHAKNELPDQAQYYHDLIPLSKPQSGEQYAFRVELDLCSGCKACVTACHSLNGLEEEEIWRNVGFIHAPENETPYQQTVTTACHHCVDPGCLNGCPVEAYEKDEATGIVRHLDDQCMGCSYCIMKCPYEVPQYSKKKGIVRKCDLCHSRLSVGEAPACVQSCPHEAIQIIIVDREKIRSETKIDETMIADGPLSKTTIPTTQYVSEKGISKNLISASRYQLRAEEGHLPLAIMLVCTQGSVGLIFLDFLARLWDWPFSQPWSAFFALVLGGVGMISATLHLGQPLKAWRFFLGLRHSWLSREILAFSLYLPLLILDLIWLWLPEMSFLPEGLPSVFFKSKTGLIFGGVTAAMGLLAIWTSVMIYHDTTKAFWKRGRSAFKFYGSTLLLGTAGLLVCSWISHLSFTEWEQRLIVVWSIIFMIKFISEIYFLRHSRASTWSPDQRTALVQLKTLAYGLGVRAFLGIMGGIVIPSVLFFVPQPYLFWVGLQGFGLLLGGEIIERSIYFKSVSASKMPGIR